MRSQCHPEAGAEMSEITAVRLGLASPDQIRARSSGEVTQPATFDPLTGQPVEGGLFCPRIFGTPAILRDHEPGSDRSACRPDEHDWTRTAGSTEPSATCSRCCLRLRAGGSPDEQRERFGHIELAVPVPHPWFASASSDDPLLLHVMPVLPAGLRLLRDRPRSVGHEHSTDELGDDANIPGLNERYRRVILANGDCARLLASGAPKAERLRGEARLAEAVSALFRALEGRLAGADGSLRADLRAAALERSAPVDAPHATVVPDPALQLGQCGLPRSLALRLFAPLVAVRLVEMGVTDDLAGAARAVERATPQALAALDEVVDDRVVVLARPPVRRRPHVLSFEPTVIDGAAIRLHPLAASALGIDETFDTVTVRASLSPVAQREARERILMTHNLLDPASGELAFEPGADVVLGCFYLTTEHLEPKGRDRRFGRWADAIRAFDLRTTLADAGIDHQARIHVRMRRDREGNLWEYDPTTDRIDPNDPDAVQADQLEMVPTTVGRIILYNTINEALREQNAAPLPFENKRIDKGRLREILTTLVRSYSNRLAAVVIEAITTLGLHYAIQAAMSIGRLDVATPPAVSELVVEADAEAGEIDRRYQCGLLDDDERYLETVRVWMDAKNAVTHAVDRGLDPFGPLTMMAQSGARGNIQQIMAMMGMIGLHVDAIGNCQLVPVRSNLSHGLTAHEYMMHAFSARMRQVPPTLQAELGDALQRRMVAALGEVVIAQFDCGTEDGIWVDGLAGDDHWQRQHDLGWLVGRYLAAEVVQPSSGLVMIAVDDEYGTIVTEDERSWIADSKVPRVRIRSPLTCASRDGVCRRCYGWHPGRYGLVEIGAPVGIMAAQAIAAPAAGLSGRSFSTGVAIARRASGLLRKPRLWPWRLRKLGNLLEARQPADAAILSEITGRVQVDEHGEQCTITIVSSEVNGEEPATRTYRLPPPRPGRGASYRRVGNEDMVSAGDRLTYGESDPIDLLRIAGRVAAGVHLVRELHDTYASDGVPLDHRHIEVVVRQLFRMIRIQEPGDTEKRPGQLVDRFAYEEEQLRVLAYGGEPATGQPVLLGLHALARRTDSFLARASFGQAIAAQSPSVRLFRLV